MDKKRIGKAYIFSKGIEYTPQFQDGFSIHLVPQAYLHGSGIYKLLNLITNECYVGATKEFYMRLRAHKSSLNTGASKHPKLIAAVKKYGIENFTFTILEHVPDLDKLVEREQYHVDTLNPEYNTCVIDVSKTKGIVKSDVTKDKIRKSIQGVKHPQWRRDQKSKSQGGEKHWTKNKGFSKEAKKNMSDAQKKLYKNGYKHPNAKKVIQSDYEGNFVAEHDSLTSAAKTVDIDVAAIGNCVRGVTKTSKGFIWKYKKEESGKD